MANIWTLRGIVAGLFVLLAIYLFAGNANAETCLPPKLFEEQLELSKAKGIEFEVLRYEGKQAELVRKFAQSKLPQGTDLKIIEFDLNIIATRKGYPSLNLLFNKGCLVNSGNMPPEFLNELKNWMAGV